MVQQIVNAVVPVAISALVAVLVAVIKAVGDAGVSFIQKKKESLQVKIGADTYNQRLQFAEQAWNITDEYFRITPTVTKTIESAQAKFAEEIKKFLPAVTDAEIEQLRQAVAGDVNRGKAAITAPVQEVVAPVTPDAK